MKEKMLHSMRKLSWGMLAVVILLFFNSCVRRVSFLASSVVPAARGYVKVKKDNNKNYVIQMSVFNLAEVSRLEPAKKGYIVWMETERNEMSNLGQLNSSSSLFSRKLKASFKTVSTIKPSKIFITAENDASLQYPGSQVIISTDNF